MPDAADTRRERILILGAAGRDFHDFNTVFRDDPQVQRGGLHGRADSRDRGTPIPAVPLRPLPPGRHPDRGRVRLEVLCHERAVDRVVLAYSDLTHAQVMHLASRALATGADFSLLGPRRTMLRSRRPVVAVSAVRTGCGKSQTARWLAARLRARGHRVVALRHPMPYGDLTAQRVQRFATRDDLDARPLHRRGARGVRALRRGRCRRVRRRRLRGDPGIGREGSRPAALGRRQQRLPVPGARRARGARRRAATGPGGHAPSGRDASCAWRTSSSSTRSTRPRVPTWAGPSPACAPCGRRCRSCAPPRPWCSTTRHACTTGGSSSWTTVPP